MSQRENVWLDTEASAMNAEPSSAAATLESIASTLREAPDGKRYDIELEVNER